MPDTPSELLTGINTTATDIANRESDLRSEQMNPTIATEPMTFTQPKLPDFHEGTVDPGQNINFDKNSYDDQMAFFQKITDQGANQYPDTAKFTDIYVPQSQTDRYTGGKFGYDINRNNETLYANDQGVFSMLGNAAVNLVGKTVGFVAQSAGFIAGAPFALGGNISNMTDNFLTRFGDYMHDSVSEAFPIYKSQKYQDGNIWQKLGTLGWWMDDATDRAALTLSMIIPGLAEAKGLGLFGTAIEEGTGALKATGIGTKAVVGLAENAADYGILGKKFLRTLNVASTDGIVDAATNPALRSYAQSLNRAELYTWNIMGQSALNAKETQAAILKATGDKEKAAQGAIASFWETVPLSLVSSLVELPQIFSTTRGIKSFLGKIIDKEAGTLKPLEEVIKGVKYAIPKKLGMALFTGVEHGTNEGLQVAVSDYNEAKATGKDKRGIVPGILGTFMEKVDDPNMQNNLALGFIQGTLTTLGGSLIGKIRGVDKAEQKQKIDLYNMINHAQLAMRGYAGDFIERDANNQPIIIDGKAKLDQSKVAQAGLELAHAQVMVDQRLKYAQDENWHALNEMNHNILTSYTQPFLTDPKGVEYLSSILKLHQKLAEDTADSRLNDRDEFGNEITPKHLYDKHIKTVHELNKIWNAIEERHAGVTTINHLDFDKTNPDERKLAAEFLNINKNLQYQKASEQLFLNTQMDMVKQNIANPDNPEKVKSPSNPIEQRYNENIDYYNFLKERLERNKQEYKTSVNRQEIKEAFKQYLENKKKVIEKVAEDTKKEAETKKNPKVQETSQQNAAQTNNPTQSDVPAPTQSPAEQTVADTEIKKEPVVKPTPPPQPLPDKEDGTYSDEHKAKTLEELKKKIPKEKVISRLQNTLLRGEITAAIKVGRLTEGGELELLALLDELSIQTDKKGLTKPLEKEPEEVKDPTDEQKDPPLDQVGGFDPTTNTVADIPIEEGLVSFLAYKTSNKTVTQEELTDLNDNYIGAVDTDPYKQHIQGFLRNMLVKQNSVQFGAKIIKDSPNFPRDRGSAAQISKSGQYGEVIAITDKKGNILHFDKNYNPTTEATDGFQPLLYSFNRVAWKDNQEGRAELGEFREQNVTKEELMQQYELEARQQELARQLVNSGQEVNVTIGHIAPGVVRFGKNPINTKIILGDQKYSQIYIPQAVEAYNEANPQQKYITTLDGIQLVNGAAYIITQLNEKNPYVYTRIIPDKISENKEMFEDIKALFDHTYKDKNQAENVRDYLKGLLFLGPIKRPTVVVTMNDQENGFVLDVLQDRVPLTTEQRDIFLAEQRMNIQKEYLGSGFDQYKIVDNKLEVVHHPDYNDLIISNSKTRTRTYDTPEGRRIMHLNTYMTFSFEDDVNTMAAKLDQLTPHPEEKAQKEKTNPEEDYYPFDKDKQENENKILTQEPLKPRRRQAIKGADEEAQRLADEYNKNRDKLEGLQAKVTKEGGKPINLNEEVSRVSAMFGGNVTIKISNIINSEAYALWRPSGIILFANAIEGSGYHEAWHNFSQLYLNKRQKQDLYNEVRKRSIDFKNRDGESLNTKTASDLDIEEFMADDFRDYVLSDGKSRLSNAPKRNTIFRQILDFIKRFFFGGVNIDKLYQELRTGDINKYTPSVNNAYWGKLSSTIVNSRGQEVFDIRKAGYYRNFIDYLMGKELNRRKLGISALKNNKTLATSVYNNIYNNLVNNHLNKLLDAQDAGESVNANLIDDLYHLTDPTNWNAFVNYHTKKSKLQTNIDFEIPDTVNEFLKNVAAEQTDDTTPIDDPEDVDQNPDTDDNSDAQFSDKGLFDRAGNETSSIDAASLETKFLIRSLPKMLYVDGTFKEDLDSNGLPRLNDYANTWNNLARELANIKGYPNMYAKMMDPTVQQRIPEVTELMKRIPHPDDFHNAAETDRMVKFERDFDKAYTGIFSGIKTQDNDFYFLEETKRNIEQINREFSNNFLSIDKSNPLMEDETVLIDADGRNYINPDVTLNYNVNNTEQRELLMQLLGIRLSDLTMQNQNVRNSLPTILAAMQDNINARLRQGIKINDPIAQLKNDIKEGKDIIIPGLKGQINGLISMEGQYSTINPSLSYQTAEGQMIYALMLHSWLTRSASNINTNDTFENFMKREEMQYLNPNNNPYVRNSVFLNSIFDLKNGRRIEGAQLQVGNYNGLKMDTNKGQKAYSTNSLNMRDKIIMDMSSLLKAGAVEIMRTEASKTAYFVRMNKYSNGSYLPVQTSKLSSGFTDPAFFNIVKGYLVDELQRMIDADKVAAALPNYPIESAKEFHLFRDILRHEKLGEVLKDRIKEEIKTKTAEETIAKYANQIEEAINTFFNHELESFKDLLSDEGITLDDLPKSVISPKEKLTYTQDQLYRSFLVNSFIMNVEYTKIFNGDTMYQAHYKDYHKRSKGDISTGITPTTADFFVRSMQATAQNTMAGFIGSSNLNDYKTTKSLVVAEDVRNSDYITHNILRDNLKKVDPNLTDEEADALLGYDKDKPAKSKGYYGMKVGDGQGHITMDFYRQFLKSIGNWSNNQEMMYQKEMAWFRVNYSGLAANEYTPEDRKKDEKFLEDNKDVVGYFPPIKMQYNGAIKAAGTFAPVMDKFSVAVMVPSIIQGTPLEKQHLEMVKHGIGYSKFVSGTKKFIAQPVTTYQNGQFNIDLSNYQAPVHFLQNLKEQINTKSDVKEESIFGSQIRKLIEANLFSQGVTSEKNLTRHMKYMSLIRAMHKNEREKLYNELGLVLKDGYTQISDLKRFVATIQKQTDLRDLNDNIKEYIQYDKDTKGVKYPLEASLNKQAIQSMINGVIDKRLRRQKINGDMLIQVSSSGFENSDFKYTKADAEETRRYGTNGLKFYDLMVDKDGKPTKVTAMQVKVSLVGGFEKLLNKTHPDGDSIGSLERLNALLKDEKWMAANRQHVNLIGYRIPTQGLNSLENMEVAEFLPAHAGSIVIPPAEIVAKSGSDFDIDKLLIFRPSFDSLGNLVNEKTAENLEKELFDRVEYKQGLNNLMSKFNIKGNIKQLADTLEVEDDTEDSPEIENIKRDLKRLANSSRDIYSNKIIELYSEILSDPEQYKALVTPNNTNLIKPISLEIAKSLGKLRAKEVKEGGKKAYEGTQIFRYKNDLRKRETLTSAKRLMAIFAVNNTFSQLIQQSNITIGNTYNTKSVFKQVTRPTRFLLMSPQERAKVFVDGKMNLSSKFAVNGVLKQEYFSQLINGAIDAPSDDFLGYVNISFENAGVIAYLINQGLPFDRILKFINQPVLVKYYSELRRSKDYKNVVQGKILSDLLGVNLYDRFTSPITGEVSEPRFNADRFNDIINNLLSLKTIPDGFYFTEKTLEDNVTGKFDKFLAQPENKKKQAALFAYFISLQEQSQLFRNFQTVLNFDTTKIQTATNADILVKKEEQIVKNGLFSRDAINQIAKNSIIAPFISNKTVIAQVANQIMPYAFNGTFMQAASDLIVNRPYLTKGKVNKLMRTIENDWIEYLVKSFGVINGVSLSTYYKTLLTGDNSLARQLITLRNEYPTLLDGYTFFNKLRQNFSNNPTVKQQNVQLQRLFENTSDDQNRYTEEFRQLINFSDSRYNDEQQFQIRKFFKDLAIMGFVQSGFNKSPISFQDIIPQEQLAGIFTSALQKYKEDVADDYQLNKSVVRDFMDKFAKNNPTLLSSKRRSTQSWRGKDYGLSFITSSSIQNALAKKKLANAAEKYQSDEAATSIPEFDEDGNAILESKIIDRINDKTARAISFQTKEPDDEYILVDPTGKNQTLAKLTLLGAYRNNLDEYTIEKLKTNERDVEVNKDGKAVAYDREVFAKRSGYDSFEDMIKDRKMLPFAAGQQIRYFYAVDPLVVAPKETVVIPQQEENLNDEPIEQAPEETVPDDLYNENDITVYQGAKGEFDDRDFNYFTTSPTEATQYGPNVRSQNINLSGYLRKYESKDGKATWTKEFNDLNKEFMDQGNPTFDILDNGEEGLQNQAKFFDFLRSKGYKGYTELVKGMKEQGENNYIVSFKLNEADQQAIENLKNKGIIKTKDC